MKFGQLYYLGSSLDHRNPWQRRKRSSSPGRSVTSHSGTAIRKMRELLLLFVQLISRGSLGGQEVWNKHHLLRHCTIYPRTEHRAGQAPPAACGMGQRARVYLSCKHHLHFSQEVSLAIPRLTDTASRTHGTLCSWVLRVTDSGPVSIYFQEKEVCSQECCSNGL